jgi:hypothetical protein
VAFPRTTRESPVLRPRGRLDLATEQQVARTHRPRRAVRARQPFQRELRSGFPSPTASRDLPRKPAPVRYSTAHERVALPLLPSGPGGVRRFSLRGAQPSTPPLEAHSTRTALEREFNPAEADCGLQGTANSPSSTATVTVHPQSNDPYRDLPRRPAPVRYSHGTREGRLTVAPFRAWRGSTILVAWGPTFNAAPRSSFDTNRPREGIQPR